MTDAALPHEIQPDERRTGERHVSVLINARIERDGEDALCRIRNLSSGGVMIECGLALIADEPVALHLRSGRRIGGTVRWSETGRAGIAFDDRDAANHVTERLASATLHSSTIGYPLFEREAWATLSAGHKRQRTRIVKLSPIGMRVALGEGLGNEPVMMVTVEGLGEHLARRLEDYAAAARDEMSLMLVQPLHYRMLDEWLSAMPRAGNAAGAGATRADSCAFS